MATAVSSEPLSTNLQQQLVTQRAKHHCDLARTYIDKSQYENAILCLNKAIGFCPENVSYYMLRAECCVNICDFQSAILNYKKVCLLETSNQIALHRLATVYFLKARCLADETLFVEALENYSHASELDQLTPGNYIGSIVCLSTLGFHTDSLALVNHRIYHEQQEEESQWQWKEEEEDLEYQHTQPLIEHKSHGQTTSQQQNQEQQNQIEHQNQKHVNQSQEQSSEKCVKIVEEQATEVNIQEKPVSDGGEECVTPGSDRLVGPLNNGPVINNEQQVMSFNNSSSISTTAATKSNQQQQQQQQQQDEYVADLLLLRARIHLTLSHSADCYGDVLSALHINSTHHEALLLKQSLDSATCQLKDEAVELSLLGRHREAIDKLNIALSTNPSMAQLRILRGTSYRHLGDFNAAIDDYLAAMATTNNNVDSDVYKAAHHQLLLTYNDFAVECINKQFYDEALLLLNKAIKDEKSMKGLYLNRAECFYRRGDLEFALSDYEQSLELDQRDDVTCSRVADIHRDIAISLFHNQQFTESEKELTTAIYYNVRDGPSYLLRAKIRDKLNQTNEARHDIVAALLLDSENPEVLTMITRLFPGKTIADILSSSLASQTKLRLAHNSDTRHSAHCQQSKNSSRSQGNNNNNNMSHATVRRDLTQCLHEQQFHQKLTTEKKIMNQSVKRLLASGGVYRLQKKATLT